MLLYKKRKKGKKKEHVRATPNQEMGRNCVKKKTKWWMDFPEGFARPTPSSMGPIFAGSGPVILGRLANRNRGRIGANNNKPNNCLVTVIDAVVSLRGSLKEKCPSTVPSEKLQLHGFCPCV